LLLAVDAAEISVRAATVPDVGQRLIAIQDLLTGCEGVLPQAEWFVDRDREIFDRP
jgi:hypothetical protein